VGFRACLLDVYDTVLVGDFTAFPVEMPLVADVVAADWTDAFARLAPGLEDGTATVREVYGQMLAGFGREADSDLLVRLLARARELLVEATTVPDDVVPALEALRRRGIATAFVSNCADDTRDLLGHHGLADLVDALVLSCEVRSAKPDPGIYSAALDALDVDPSEAVFVDDQPPFCAGAAALGITAVRIDRFGRAPAEEPDVVSSLTQVLDWF
jgi:putative hydrolase of the HAD superfamily